MKITDNDIVENAMSRIKEDPGAIFEEEVLAQLIIIRDSKPAEWQRIRTCLKNVNNVQMSEIDRLTKSSCHDQENTPTLFPAEILWPEAVDGAELLDSIVLFIQCHIVADLATIQASALWIIFTWLIDVVDIAPIANITAPEKRCGKSELLAIFGLLVYRPLLTANMTTATIFRVADKYHPTLLIDEVDTFLATHDDTRGILNAGFTRSAAFVWRCVGDDHEATPFSVWGAKALCGIGGIDKVPTLADRSIPLRLRRKLTGEKSIKVRRHDQELAAILRQKLARFAQDAQADIKAYQPLDVAALNDRANDCWEPLFAVANVAGGHWPKIALNAAIALHGVEEYEPTLGEQLLSSIKDVFDEKGCDQLRSIDLLQELIKDDESPWATWNRGNPITPHQLAKRLGDYGIKGNRTVRFGAITAKGYKLKWFDEVFKRYLPKPNIIETVTSSQPLPGIANNHFPIGNNENNVTDSNTSKTMLDMGGDDVTDLSPLIDYEEF